MHTFARLAWGMMAGVAAISIGLLPVPALADVKAGYEAWERGDYATAVAEWRTPAVAGDATAQFNLGQAYKLGRGVAMDHAQAVSWFKRAADQGHREAFDNLGILLFNMNRRNEALPYILKSAERGEARAQYILGTASFNGDLVAKDWPRAYALMQRASTKGLAIASARLAELDKYIPLDQRQKGLALAADMEREERRATLAQLSNIPSGAIGTSGTAAIDADAVMKPAPAVAKPTTAKVTAVPAPKVTTPKAVPAAPRPAPPTAASTGPWTTQLGAFSNQQNASKLWAQLSGRAPFSGYSPRYVKAGAIIRLQAGAFPTRDAAASFCRAAANAGQNCIPAKR